MFVGKREKREENKKSYVKETTKEDSQRGRCQREKVRKEDVGV